MSYFEKLDGFLKENLLHPDAFDFGAEVKKVLDDMEAGLAGAGSMLMLPAFLSCGGKKPRGRALVIDAGGTNLRVGSVRFSEGTEPFAEFGKFPLPGTGGEEVSCGGFFDDIADRLSEYTAASERIGFCFSFAARCREDHDGELINFGKEVRVTGAEGAYICRELKKALKRRGDERDYKTVLLNDSVAVYLGEAAGAENDGEYSGVVSAVLGTGFNVCYQEKTKNIVKYKGSMYTDSETVINTEAGYYNGLPRGSVDEEIDSSSAIVGDHWSEKLMSGAYLGRVITKAVMLAARAGFVSDGAAEELRRRGELTMPEINAFLEGGELFFAKCPEDAAAVRRITERVYGRTAAILAIFLTAAAEKSGPLSDKPIRIVIDGSTYNKSPLLQKYLEEQMERVGAMYGRRFVLSAPRDNATLIGAAYAALSV